MKDELPELRDADCSSFVILGESRTAITTTEAAVTMLMSNYNFRYYNMNKAKKNEKIKTGVV